MSAFVHQRAVAVTAILLVGAATLMAALTPSLPVPEKLPQLAPPQAPQFAATLAAHLGSPVVDGNRVELLLNGDAIFPAKLAAIKGARERIDYAEYFWSQGPIGAEIAEALAERCRAGVRANVLLDGVGSFGMPSEHVETMTRGGCHVERFRPLARWSLRRHNNRNHRRILLVDGRLAITGGSGVSWKWSGNGREDEHWRDTDVRLEGPAVAGLAAAFAENWREATGELLTFPPPPGASGDSRVQVVKSSPDEGSYGAYTMLLLAIAGARRAIYITNPYFVPDARMAEALVAAVRRGVHVVALTPGRIDHNVVRAASRRDLGRLLRGGVEVFEYQAALLHAKTMVIDEAWATIGSTNLDSRSFALNDELNVAVYDARVARRLHEAFEEDLRHARRLPYEAWEQRGWRAKLLEALVLPVRDLL
jgi:cardiolipin synthase A/B